jgi:hypothetical protein
MLRVSLTRTQNGARSCSAAITQPACVISSFDETVYALLLGVSAQTRDREEYVWQVHVRSQGPGGDPDHHASKSARKKARNSIYLRAYRIARKTSAADQCCTPAVMARGMGARTRVRGPRVSSHSHSFLSSTARAPSYMEVYKLHHPLLLRLPDELLLYIILLARSSYDRRPKQAWKSEADFQSPSGIMRVCWRLYKLVMSHP